MSRRSNRRKKATKARSKLSRVNNLTMTPPKPKSLKSLKLLFLPAPDVEMNVHVIQEKKRASPCVQETRVRRNARASVQETPVSKKASPSVPLQNIQSDSVKRQDDKHSGPSVLFIDGIRNQPAKRPCNAESAGVRSKYSSPRSSDGYKDAYKTPTPLDVQKGNGAKAYKTPRPLDVHKGNGAKEEQVDIKDQINLILCMHAKGIALEKFSLAFLREHGMPLIPAHHGFYDIVDLLKSMPDIVDIKCLGRSGQMLLLPKPGVSMATRQPPSASLPVSVVETFRHIVKENKAIRLEDLVPEYEMRTGQKLDVTELGVLSIPDLLCRLSDVFKVWKRDYDYILYDSTISDIHMSRDMDETGDTLTDFEERRHLPNNTKLRLKHLLEVEFPKGLCIDELLGAYKGLFGANLDDLDHEQYGYLSLEGLLRGYPCVASVQQGSVGKARVMPPFTVIPQEEMSVLACHAVKIGECFPQLDLSALLSLGALVEVVVGEVYSPHHFWLITRGRHTSKALDNLMDCMFEFYSSSVGERYRVPRETLEIGVPVVALYADDMNFYRAIVTCIDNQDAIKVFFVDYGTACLSTVKTLYFLHKNFFSLPTQGFKAALLDIEPHDKRQLWSRAASKRFQNMIHNKGLMAEMVDFEDPAHVRLWDNSSGDDVDIERQLVQEGWAVRKASGRSNLSDEEQIKAKPDQGESAQSFDVTAEADTSIEMDDVVCDVGNALVNASAQAPVDPSLPASNLADNVNSEVGKATLRATPYPPVDPLFSASDLLGQEYGESEIDAAQRDVASQYQTVSPDRFGSDAVMRDPAIQHPKALFDKISPANAAVDSFSVASVSEQDHTVSVCTTPPKGPSHSENISPLMKTPSTLPAQEVPLPPENSSPLMKTPVSDPPPGPSVSAERSSPLISPPSSDTLQGQPYTQYTQVTGIDSPPQLGYPSVNSALQSWQTYPFPNPSLVNYQLFAMMSGVMCEAVNSILGSFNLPNTPRVTPPLALPHNLMINVPPTQNLLPSLVQLPNSDVKYSVPMPNSVTDPNPVLIPNDVSKSNTVPIPNAVPNVRQGGVLQHGPKVKEESGFWKVDVTVPPPGFTPLTEASTKSNECKLPNSENPETEPEFVTPKPENLVAQTELEMPKPDPRARNIELTRRPPPGFEVYSASLQSSSAIPLSKPPVVNVNEGHYSAMDVQGTNHLAVPNIQQQRNHLAPPVNRQEPKPLVISSSHQTTNHPTPTVSHQEANHLPPPGVPLQSNYKPSPITASYGAVEVPENKAKCRRPQSKYSSENLSTPGKDSKCPAAGEDLRRECLTVNARSLPADVPQSSASESERVPTPTSQDVHPYSDDIFYSDDNDAASDYPSYPYESEVQPILLAPNTKLHVVILNSEPYLLSSQVSCLICAGEEELQACLDDQGLNVPTIILNKEDDQEVYVQLMSCECADIYSKSGNLRPRLVLYCLQSLPIILHTVGCRSLELFEASQRLVSNFAKDFGDEAKMSITNQKQTVDSCPPPRAPPPTRAENIVPTQYRLAPLANNSSATQFRNTTLLPGSSTPLQYKPVPIPNNAYSATQFKPGSLPNSFSTTIQPMCASLLNTSKSFSPTLVNPHHGVSKADSSLTTHQTLPTQPQVPSLFAVRRESMHSPTPIQSHPGKILPASSVESGKVSAVRQFNPASVPEEASFTTPIQHQAGKGSYVAPCQASPMVKIVGRIADTTTPLPTPVLTTEGKIITTTTRHPSLIKTAAGTDDPTSYQLSSMLINDGRIANTTTRTPTPVLTTEGRTIDTAPHQYPLILKTTIDPTYYQATTKLKRDTGTTNITPQYPPLLKTEGRDSSRIQPLPLSQARVDNNAPLSLPAYASDISLTSSSSIRHTAVTAQTNTIPPVQTPAFTQTNTATQTPTNSITQAQTSAFRQTPVVIKQTPTLTQTHSTQTPSKTQAPISLLQKAIDTIRQPKVTTSREKRCVSSSTAASSVKMITSTTTSTADFHKHEFSLAETSSVSASSMLTARFIRPGNTPVAMTTKSIPSAVRAQVAVPPKMSSVALPPKSTPVALPSKIAPATLTPKIAPVTLAPKTTPVTLAPKFAPVVLAPKIAPVVSLPKTSSVAPQTPVLKKPSDTSMKSAKPKQISKVHKKDSDSSETEREKLIQHGCNIFQLRQRFNAKENNKDSSETEREKVIQQGCNILQLRQRFNAKENNNQNKPDLSKPDVHKQEDPLTYSTYSSLGSEVDTDFDSNTEIGEPQVEMVASSVAKFSYDATPSEKITTRVVECVAGAGVAPPVNTLLVEEFGSDIDTEFEYMSENGFNGGVSECKSNVPELKSTRNDHRKAYHVFNVQHGMAQDVICARTEKAGKDYVCLERDKPCTGKEKALTNSDIKLHATEPSRTVTRKLPESSTLSPPSTAIARKQTGAQTAVKPASTLGLPLPLNSVRPKQPVPVANENMIAKVPKPDEIKIATLPKPTHMVVKLPNSCENLILKVSKADENEINELPKSQDRAISSKDIASPSLNRKVIASRLSLLSTKGKKELKRPRVNLFSLHPISDESKLGKKNLSISENSKTEGHKTHEPSTSRQPNGLIISGKHGTSNSSKEKSIGEEENYSPGKTEYISSCTKPGANQEIQNAETGIVEKLNINKLVQENLVNKYTSDRSLEKVSLSFSSQLNFKTTSIQASKAWQPISSQPCQSSYESKESTLSPFIPATRDQGGKESGQVSNLAIKQQKERAVGNFNSSTIQESRSIQESGGQDSLDVSNLADQQWNQGVGGNSNSSNSHESRGLVSYESVKGAAGNYFSKNSHESRCQDSHVCVSEAKHCANCCPSATVYSKPVLPTYPVFLNPMPDRRSSITGYLPQTMALCTTHRTLASQPVQPQYERIPMPLMHIPVQAPQMPMTFAQQTTQYTFSPYNPGFPYQAFEYSQQKDSYYYSNSI